MRVVSKYNGSEITTEVLEKMWEIINSSKVKDDYAEFCDLEDDFYMVDGKCADEYSHVIIGDDWFINYDVAFHTVIISLWYCCEKSDNKISQIIEEISAIKKILLDYPDYLFEAKLRHNTSYPFLQKFASRGDFEIHSDNIDVFGHAPHGVETEYEELTHTDVFEGDSAEKNKWICHKVVFSPTKTFKKRYERRNNEGN